MRVTAFLMTAAAAILLSAMALAADNSGRIYGEITTVDGDVLKGLIRWDKNEGSWVDLLNGSKDLRDDRDRDRSLSKRKRYSDRRRSIELFGIKIIDDDGLVHVMTGVAQSGIRFGHIKTMKILDDDMVRLDLKSGREAELFDGSTDIGTSIREIVIEDESEGELELAWDDIERIDFMAAGTSEPSSFGDRLYGTVTTRRGEDYSGFICWDVDEIFTGDVLDGVENSRKRKIRFDKIASIERYSSKGATVVTRTGDEYVLRGTNDVNSSNRGIGVSDPGLGQVTVGWDEFERVVFSDPPSMVRYDDFDGGRPLQGTVFTEDGNQYTGTICWDDDEEYTWEILDGEYRDLEFDVEFGLIKQIEKKSYRAAIVTVWDGRSFQLRGSNDVDEDNKGIIVVMDDGEEAIIDWEEFTRVEFVKP
ncbi:MAG TPA: hypothetical protein VMY05_03965 [Acidobacteriota bacterium]|nr:hypothetical protein [Acidobacteriota bacterium]